MAKTIRDKIIKVRVSAEEHETLKHICPKSELASWMRENCLNPTVDLVNGLKSQSGTIADPELIRGLAGIGNNMNQIARKINDGTFDNLSTIQILAALKNIESELAAVRTQFR
jgi:hypothetical protein